MKATAKARLPRAKMSALRVWLRGSSKDADDVLDPGEPYLRYFSKSDGWQV